MARHRQDVRKYFQGQELVPSKNLFGYRKEGGHNVASGRLPLKEEPKVEEQATSPKIEKCGWGPDCPFCRSQKKEEESKQQQKPPPNVPRPQARRPDTLSLNQKKTAMGSRDGEIELQVQSRLFLRL